MFAISFSNIMLMVIHLLENGDPHYVMNFFHFIMNLNSFAPFYFYVLYCRTENMRSLGGRSTKNYIKFDIMYDGYVERNWGKWIFGCH